MKPSVRKRLRAAGIEVRENKRPLAERLTAYEDASGFITELFRLAGEMDPCGECPKDECDDCEGCRWVIDAR